MNCGATTGFLPNFVGFPSPRGLQRSTVQPRRAPRARKCPSAAVARRALLRAPDAFPPEELSCPVSAASAASAPAATGRPAPAGRPARAGRRSPAGRRSTAATRPAGPPAARGTAARAALPLRGLGRLRRLRQRDLLVLAASESEDRDQRAGDDCQDDANDHGATLLSFPRSDPPWALRFLRERGMPPRLTCQSRVEELQSLLPGQRPLTCTEGQFRGRPWVTGPPRGRDLPRRGAQVGAFGRKHEIDRGLVDNEDTAFHRPSS